MENRFRLERPGFDFGNVSQSSNTIRMFLVSMPRFRLRPICNFLSSPVTVEIPGKIVADKVFLPPSRTA